MWNCQRRRDVGWWRVAAPSTAFASGLFGSQIRCELERQSLLARQPFAFRVHLVSTLLHRWKDRGDLVQVQVGRDARVARTLNHRAELSVLELLEGPVQRLLDHRPIPVDAMVLVARAVMVMRA